MVIGIYRPDEAAGYTYLPGYSDKLLTINSFGLRGREPHRPGIALIGDSIVAAQEIEWPLTAAAILEKRTEVEVVPIAVAGWSPQCQLGFIEQHGFFGAAVAILVLNRGDIWAADISGPPSAGTSALSRIARRFKRPPLRTSEIRKICDLTGRLAIAYHLSRGEAMAPAELTRLADDRNIPLHIVAYPDDAYLDHIHVTKEGQGILAEALMEAYLGLTAPRRQSASA